MMSPTGRYALDLGFKGNRDYLHGTDLVDAMILALETAMPGERITNIDFSFHRIVRRKVMAVLGAPDGGTSPAAVCRFDSGDRRLEAYLEETDQPVTLRTAYPEHEIVRDFGIDAGSRSGILRGRPPFSELEIWVAMVKALHHVVFPNATGKWWFVRGLLPRYARESRASERQATLVSAMGERLTRSEIALDGRKAADIFFARSAAIP